MFIYIPLAEKVLTTASLWPILTLIIVFGEIERNTKLN